MNERKILKAVDLRLISELMKNGRKTDRQLAKAVGVSQPTISRTRSRLENAGIIREYTIIPDFGKLGFELVAFTFANLKSGLSKDEVESARKEAKQRAAERGLQSVMIVRGTGLRYQLVVGSFHEDYSSYVEFKRQIKQFPYIDERSIDSFIVSPSEEQYRNLTFSTLATYILHMKRREGAKP